MQLNFMIIGARLIFKLKNSAVLIIVKLYLYISFDDI